MAATCFKCRVTSEELNPNLHEWLQLVAVGWRYYDDGPLCPLCNRARLSTKKQRRHSHHIQAPPAGE